MNSIRTMLRRPLPVVLSVYWMSCLHCTRPDDGMEPNDDIEHATRLIVGQTVDGRANQGDDDVFLLDVERLSTVVYRMESMGLEDCPTFTASGSTGDVLYRDVHFNCRRGPEPAEQVSGAGLTLVPGFGYELRVPATCAGTYLLIIHEQGMADNIAPFSWDYRLTVSLE